MISVHLYVWSLRLTNRVHIQHWICGGKIPATLQFSELDRLQIALANKLGSWFLLKPFKSAHKPPGFFFSRSFSVHLCSLPCAELCSALVAI